MFRAVLRVPNVRKLLHSISRVSDDASSRKRPRYCLGTFHESSDDERGASWAPTEIQY